MLPSKNFIKYMNLIAISFYKRVLRETKLHLEWINNFTMDKVKCVSFQIKKYIK